MPTYRQLRRATTATMAGRTGLVGELMIDLDKDVVVVHDGATAGGFPGQRELPNWSNVRFVAASGGNNTTAALGNPAKPYATVAAAIAAAASGETVFCLPGSHSCGNTAIQIPANVRLIGAGMDCTTLSFNGQFHNGNSGGVVNNTVAVGPATGVQTDKVYVSDLTIDVAYYNTSNIAPPIGVAPTSVGAPHYYPDLIVRRVRTTAFFDGYYNINAEIRGYFYECEFRSEWDLVYSGNGTARYWNCTFIWAPRYDTRALGGSIMQGSGSVELNNCHLILDGGSGGENDNLLEATSLGIGSAAVVYNGLTVENRGGWTNGKPAILGGATTNHILARPIISVSPNSHNDGVSCWQTAAPKLHCQTPTWLEFHIFGDSGISASNRHNRWLTDAAATSQTFDLMKLPAGAIVKEIILETRQQFFSLSATAATVEVGISGNTTKYLTAQDVYSGTDTVRAASVDTMEAEGDPETGTATTLQAVFRSTTANVNTMLQGNTIIKILVSGGMGALV